MIKYAVVEIAGRQYQVMPGQNIVVDHLAGDLKTFECNKVLLMASDDKLNVGEHYLKDKLVFEVINSFKDKKIRVAKYHPKANTRKVTGSRRALTTLKLREKA